MLKPSAKITNLIFVDGFLKEKENTARLDDRKVPSLLPVAISTTLHITLTVCLYVVLFFVVDLCNEINRLELAVCLFPFRNQISTIIISVKYVLKFHILLYDTTICDK